MECLKVDCLHFKSNVNVAIILEKEGQVTQAFDYYAKAAE